MSTRILILKNGVITPSRSATDISDINNSLGITAALNLKANLASPTFTGTVSGITSSMVGLGNIINSLQLVASNNLSDLVSRQTALNNISGAVTSGTYLRGNGTNVLLSTIQASDVPTLNQNTTGTSSNITGTLLIANGGTGATTQQTAINALVGTQTANRVLRSNGTNMLLAQVGLTTDVTGILPIANGGTNSSTQNFVDLTTTQTVGGSKTFSSPLIVSDTTGATSTTTGALRVGGGGSVVGNWYTGGFTSLGDNVALKIKRLTGGTTGATQGSSVFQAHGLTGSKIVAVIASVEYDPGSWMSSNHTFYPGYEFTAYVAGANIDLGLKSGNSANILSKPFAVILIYIP